MNDGGPVFPSQLERETDGSWRKTYIHGISLRDLFVTAIAAGDWASQSEEVGEYTSAVSDEILENRAKVYGRMADAMIKERECAESK